MHAIMMTCTEQMFKTHSNVNLMQLSQTQGLYTRNFSLYSLCIFYLEQYQVLKLTNKSYNS